MMTKAELAFSALDRDNKDNLVNINQQQDKNINITKELNVFFVAEKILGPCTDFVTRYCRAISLRKISRN